MKENPKPPLKLVGAASASSSKLPMKITLKELGGSLAQDITKKERDGSLAGDSEADHGAHNSSSGCTQSYLCAAKNDARMNSCHACMSLFGTSRDVKDGAHRRGAPTFRLQLEVHDPGIPIESAPSAKESLQAWQSGPPSRFLVRSQGTMSTATVRSELASASRPCRSGTRS